LVTVPQGLYSEYRYYGNTMIICCKNYSNTTLRSSDPWEYWPFEQVTHRHLQHMVIWQNRL